MADGFGQGEGIITVVQRHPYVLVNEDNDRMAAAIEEVISTIVAPETDVVVDDDTTEPAPEAKPVVAKKATRKKAT